MGLGASGRDRSRGFRRSATCGSGQSGAGDATCGRQALAGRTACSVARLLRPLRGRIHRLHDLHCHVLAEPRSQHGRDHGVLGRARCDLGCQRLSLGGADLEAAWGARTCGPSGGCHRCPPLAPAASQDPAIAGLTVAFALGQCLGPILFGVLSDGPAGLSVGLNLSVALLLAGLFVALAQRYLETPTWPEAVVLESSTLVRRDGCAPPEAPCLRRDRRVQPAHGRR